MGKPGTFFLSLATLLAGLTHEARAQETQDYATAGDILQYAIPLAGLTAAFVQKDWQGAKQVGATVATALGTANLMKLGISKWRPDLADENSFPSGHTAAAFAGAAFIDMRYGWEFGVPAYALAAFTGYTRLRIDTHFVDDVVSGMSIGLLSAAMWTSPLSGTVRPILGENREGKSFGVLISLRGPNRERSAQQPDWDFTPTWRFRWEFGPVWEQRNRIQVPSGAGTPFDHAGFRTLDNPTTSATVSIEAFLGAHKRHELILLLVPYQRNDFGSFSQSTNIGGVLFPANTVVRTSYAHYEVRLRWRYELMPDHDDFSVKLGAGLSFLYSSIEVLNTRQTGQRARGNATGILPVLHAHASWAFLRKWRVYAEADGFLISGDEYLLDATAGILWRFHPQWELSLGFRLYALGIDRSDLKNRLQLNRLYLGLAYSW